MNVPVDVIFNRDILINETQTIKNCKESLGVLSLETVVSNHPWVTDVDKELARIKKEKAAEQTEMDSYKDSFNQNGDKVTNNTKKTDDPGAGGDE